MKGQEYTDAEIDELDSFLQFEFNHDIYEQLSGDDWEDFKGLFEPLEFFKLLYSQIEFIEENKARPLFVTRNLKKLTLTDKQLWYFLFKLQRYFDDDTDSDEPLKICCNEILKIQDKLEVFEDPEEEAEPNPYDFGKILEHLESLTTFQEKISFLIEKRVVYQQNRNLNFEWGGPTFAEKCNLEIEKLEKLARLTPKPKGEPPEPGKHRDARLERVVLTLNYLLDGAGVSETCQKSKRINFIDFVSPYSRNTIKPQLDKLHEKASENPFEYKEDMKMIRGYFEALGLNEIVKQIDRDLEFET